MYHKRCYQIQKHFFLVLYSNHTSDEFDTYQILQQSFLSMKKLHSGFFKAMFHKKERGLAIKMFVLLFYQKSYIQSIDFSQVLHKSLSSIRKRHSSILKAIPRLGIAPNAKPLFFFPLFCFLIDIYLILCMIALLTTK